MTTRLLFAWVRLLLGVLASGYGLTWGLWLHVTGHSGEALAHALLWGLAGCIVAPLAEDVGDMLQRLKQARSKPP